MRGDRDRIAKEATIVEPADGYQSRPEGVRFAKGMFFGVGGGLLLWAAAVVFVILAITR